jgi:ATP synthase protein I
MNAEPVEEKDEDAVVNAARQAAEREKTGMRDPEPSLANRLGQIGVLGWATVIPILIGLVVGHWMDRLFSTGIMFSAALIMLGAVLGMWSAWKWMHRS